MSDEGGEELWSGRMGGRFGEERSWVGSCFHGTFLSCGTCMRVRVDGKAFTASVGGISEGTCC